MIYLRFIRSRRMWIVGTVVLAAGMALVLALVRSPNTVEAKSSYLSSMMNTYPALNNTKLDSCQTCHTNFGTMWMASLASPCPPNVGLTGVGLTGQMWADEDHFVVEGVPLSPYNDSDAANPDPYQLAHLVAKDANTGTVLAETTFVAPVSNEIHCENCHSDGQQEDIATGNVRRNILTLHDEEEDTNLMASEPVLCAGCHASPALGTTGVPGVPNLSRAMHDNHAPDIDDDGKGDEEGGGDASPTGGTQARPGDDVHDGDDDTALITNVIGWMRGESSSATGSTLPGLAPVDEGTTPVPEWWQQMFLPGVGR